MRVEHYLYFFFNNLPTRCIVIRDISSEMVFYCLKQKFDLNFFFKQNCVWFVFEICVLLIYPNKNGRSSRETENLGSATLQIHLQLMNV